MRGISKLIGVSLLAVGLLATAPPVASAADQWVFRAPAARPTDDPDPNRHAYEIPEASRSPACGQQFCVHWVAEGVDAPALLDADGLEDGDGIPDFVEQVQEVAEHTYEVENVQLGWRDAKSDGRRGGGKGKTDVYLAQIGGSLFGYAAPDKGQASKDHRLPRRLHGYLVLDNDYDPSEFPGTNPLDDLEVTFAHEYNHILQFGYDAYQDAWFAESTATWMEDQVYNGVNDYLRYVRRWARLYDTPITETAIREYGSAVWNHWLTRRYGRSIVRKAWAWSIHVRPGRLLGRRLRPRDPRRRRLGLQPRLRPLRPRRRRVAHPEHLPRGLALPRPPAPGQPLGRTACRASGRSTTPPSSCSSSTPAEAVPWSSKRRRRSARRSALPWSGGSATRSAAMSSPGSATSRTAARCRCGSRDRGASAG